jgi:hypothetical protein
VRERDNLPNGDLDRTHRQQAVIDYVIWKLGHEGIFSSIGQLTSLLGVAKRYVITDSGWQMLDFATEMKSLTGSHLTFITAPVITTNGHIDNQDVNLIDPAAIKKEVQRAFYSPASSKRRAPKTRQSKVPSLSPGQTTVDVLNGGAPAGMAGEMSHALTAAGYQAGKVANTTPQSNTQVLYGAGAQASAQKIAGAFQGVAATASSTVAAGHVELLLAADATSVPANIGTATAPPPSPSATPTSSSNDGQAGKPVKVKSNAKYGIPCVY